MNSTDRFCRGCGHVLRIDIEEPGTPVGQQRTVVLFLLFFVLGPIALKRLWASPEFSATERIVFTLLSVAEVILVGNVLVQSYVSYIAELADLGAI